jgi:hypothetical protein
MTTTDRRLWRTAGWLLLTFIALTFVGVAFQPSLMLGDTPAHARDALMSSSMSKSFGGGYVEYLATLAYLVGGLLVARLVTDDSATGGWLRSCATAALTAQVAVTVAVGFAAGAAAIYDGHHGADLATVTAVNDIRNFAFFLSGGLAGVFVLAVAVATLVTKRLPGWVGYSGIVLGALYVLTIPAARTGVINIATLGGFVWLVALGIAAMRRASTSAVARSSAAPVAA